VSNLIAQPGIVPQAPENPAEELNLAELWRTLKRRKRLVLVTAGAVIGLTAIKTAYDRIFQPTYQGSFSLLISDPINPDNQQQSAGAGGLIEQVARNSSSTDIPTLIALLQSPVLLNPVYTRNPKAASTLRSLAINGGDDRRSGATGILNISLQASDPREAQVLLNDLANTYLKIAQVQRQQRLADGIKFLNLQAPALQRKSADLQQQLALFRQRNTVLEPTEEGAALKSKMLGQGDEILNLKAQRSKLLNVRQAIVNGSLSARSFEEAIASPSGNSGGGSSSAGGLSVADSNQSLLEQLTKLDKQLAESRARYTPNSSMLKGLETQRQRLMPILRQSQLEAVESALRSNQISLAVALQQQAQLKTIFQGKPQLIKEYEGLQQKLKIANENLASFIQAKENFQLEIAQKTVPWKVIAPPQVSSTPITPSIPRNLALGVVLGLVAGAGAGLLRDRLDHVFHNPVEVEDDLKQTLLGHIPHVDFFKGVREDRRFVIEELDLKMDTKSTSGAAEDGKGLNGTKAPNQLAGYQRFFYQEAFRNLFTSLRFLNSDQPLRSVALTSSIPNEGKSLVNVLLAKTLSEMGKRVLLIDADLRKPQMHYRLGLNNLLGLSNVLAEENCSWRDAIQQVKNYPGWSVITSGTRPPDPTRLLSSARMHQVAQEISQSGLFDLVIYDTPPILGLADAVLVAEHVDGLILLVSLNRVDRGLPKDAINRIRSSGASLLGLVTNAVKEETTGSSAYGYGYSKSKYGYGYGYGAYDTRSAYAYYNNDADNNDLGNNDAEESGNNNVNNNGNRTANSKAADTTTASAWSKGLTAMDWPRQMADVSKTIARWIDR
jgi:capsular exopolysaccharide synthesis family protein